MYLMRMVQINLHIVLQSLYINRCQVVAVMYLTLTALIQLNLIATRNPSFWWRFSTKTAPR